MTACLCGALSGLSLRSVFARAHDGQNASRDLWIKRALGPVSEIRVIEIDLPEQFLIADRHGPEGVISVRIIVRQMSWTHSSEVEDLTFPCRAGCGLS